MNRCEHTDWAAEGLPSETDEWESLYGSKKSRIDFERHCEESGYEPNDEDYCVWVDQIIEERKEI